MFATVQQLAQYRVQLKRNLRKAGVQFSNDDSTEVLESLTKALQDTVEVTFDRFSPKQLAGKTVQAVKVVKQYSEDFGDGTSYTWEDVSYLYDGHYYGSEFFI